MTTAESPVPEVPTALQVRRLVRASDRGALATLVAADSQGAPDHAGWPWPSLVLLACDHDGAPILLLSTLAEHTRGLIADGRVALLVEQTRELEDPLSGPRATLLGRIAPSAESRHRGRYLARHPSAATYIDFQDFAIYRLTLDRAHLVGGYGAIAWVAGADLTLDVSAAGPLIAAEADIVAHMNRDHADAIGLYAVELAGRRNVLGWVMTGIDPEGFDLRRGAETARVDFPAPVHGPDEVRHQLVALTEEARRRRRQSR